MNLTPPFLRSFLLSASVFLSLATGARADVVIGVDSPAAKFSPATWAGDAGRGGTQYRRTWNNGAWCQFKWTSPAEHPAGKLHVTNQTAGSTIAYFLDGSLTANVPVADKGDITLAGFGAGHDHTLVMYAATSQQKDRWEGPNTFTVTGLSVDDGSTPAAAEPARPWVLIIGDSITEGIGAGSSLGDYAFLVGQGLRLRGYDTGVSACGYSGWIRPGDAGGDVLPYYAMHDGIYADKTSRWNKIDSHTSLLDSAGHLSGQGQTGQEPSAIVINYIVNETLSHSSPADAQASITGCLSALRAAAPKAAIIVLMPPGLPDTRVYAGGAPYMAALRDGVSAYQKTARADTRTVLIDLGPELARALGSAPYGGSVHPNAAGHALQAPIIFQAINRYLE